MIISPSICQSHMQQSSCSSSFRMSLAECQHSIYGGDFNIICGVILLLTLGSVHILHVLVLSLVLFCILWMSSSVTSTTNPVFFGTINTSCLTVSSASYTFNWNCLTVHALFRYTSILICNSMVGIDARVLTGVCSGVPHTR